VVLAETLGSLAANLAVGLDSYCVGLEVNANHVRAKRDGVVTGRCSPLHLGATTQVWQIDILDEQKRLVCTSRLTMAVLKHKSHR
ncbi:MAG: hotdog fold thioesterase, partial [Aeromonas sp.]